jgi:hypothetical protein
VISRPASSIEPELGKSKPLRMLTSVVLPAPFGPISPTTSCRWSSSEISLRAWTPSNDRETPVAWRDPPGHRSVSGEIAEIS